MPGDGVELEDVRAISERQHVRSVRRIDTVAGGHLLVARSREQVGGVGLALAREGAPRVDGEDGAERTSGVARERVEHHDIVAVDDALVDGHGRHVLGGENKRAESRRRERSVHLRVCKLRERGDVRVGRVTNERPDALERDAELSEKQGKVVAAVREPSLQVHTVALDGHHGLAAEGGAVAAKVGERDLSEVDEGVLSLAHLRLGLAEAVLCGLIDQLLRVQRGKEGCSAAANRSWQLPPPCTNLCLRRVYPADRLLQRCVGRVDLLVLDLAAHDHPPRVVTLLDDVHRVLGRLHVLPEGEHVERLAVWHLVGAEPRESRVEETGDHSGRAGERGR
mmetsp:Transcript_2587/g.7759  ORF Transcript_2587/g.7759 Transcript_2587/m.7759 type:complete len:337 (-) Transcript_2587:42-1052(-)